MPPTGLVDRREAIQHFEAPPEKVTGDENAEPDLYELDNQLVFAHLGSPARIRLCRPTYHGTTTPLKLSPCIAARCHGKGRAATLIHRPETVRETVQRS
jgi:hypothetical protein